MQARFLTTEERVLAVHRIRANNTGILNRQFKWNQVKEALNPFQDAQGLLLFLTIFCNEVLKYVISLPFFFIDTYTYIVVALALSVPLQSRASVSIRFNLP